MKPFTLANAFEPGARAVMPGGEEAVFWCRTIADLMVPSGRIVACDPFVYADAFPFARTVPPGRYPVVLALADFARSADQRVAAAMLRLRETEPVRWELATLGEDDTNGSKGYGVDSGMGAFMDDEAVEALLGIMGEAGDDDYLLHRLEDQRGSGSSFGPEWFDLRLDEKTGLNIALFTSGWGDGIYASYWGFDADGGLACLVTDLRVLDGATRPD